MKALNLNEDDLFDLFALLDVVEQQISDLSGGVPEGDLLEKPVVTISRIRAFRKEVENIVYDPKSF